MKNFVFITLSHLYVLLYLLPNVNINKECRSDFQFVCHSNQNCFQKTLQNQTIVNSIDSLIIIQKSNKYGLVNHLGDTILPVEFYDIKLIKKSVAILKRSYFWESVELNTLNFKVLDYNHIGNFSKKSNWKAPFYRDYLVGIIDTNFNEIIIDDCIELSDFNDGIAIYQTFYGEGIVDQYGLKLTKPIYRYLKNINQGKTFFIRDSFFGILDQNGKEIITNQTNEPFLDVVSEYYDSTQFLISFDNDSTFSSNGELFKMESIFDYLFSDFKTKFLNQNDRIYNVTINNVFVSNNNRSSVYDRQGNLIISMDNVSIVPLGLASFDEYNNQIIPTPIISEVYIVSTKNQKEGLLNNNTLVLDTIYDKISPINQNLIEVELNARSAICNKLGNFLLQFNYSLPSYNEYNYYKILDNTNSNKVGFYNQNGEIIIPTIYDDGIRINDELFALKSNKKWGILDSKSEIIIPFEFDSIIPFELNRILAQKNGLWGIINTNGKIILPFDYDKIGQFDSGLFIACKNNFLWFVDYDGNIISDKILDNGSIRLENGLIFKSKMILGSWSFPESNIKILKHGKHYEIQF
jgi:hypothetical protein